MEGVLETEGRRSIEGLQTPYGLRGRYMPPCLNECKSVIEHGCPAPELHRSKSEYSTHTLSYIYSSACQRCLLNLSLPVLPHLDLKISEYPTTPCETSQPPRFDAFFPPSEVAASPLWQTILPLPHPAPFVRRIEPCMNSLPDAVSDMPKWRKWCD